MTLERSPEFFKPRIFMYLLKTDHALVSPWWAIFPRSSILSKFKKYGPLGDIRDLVLVVSNQEILYVSNYKSM